MLSPYVGVITGLYIFENAFGAILLYHLGIIFPLIASLKEFSLKDLTHFVEKRYLAALPLCALAGVALWFLWPWMALPGADLKNTLELYGLGEGVKIPFLLYFSFFHPVLEELYWRFVLKKSPLPAIMIDLSFALYHVLVVRLFIRMEFVFLAAVVLTCAAWFWRYLRDKKGENLIIFISHAAADFSILAAIYALSGETFYL